MRAARRATKAKVPQAMAKVLRFQKPSNVFDDLWVAIERARQLKPGGCSRKEIEAARKELRDLQWKKMEVLLGWSPDGCTYCSPLTALASLVREGQITSDVEEHLRQCEHALNPPAVVFELATRRASK